MSKTGRDFLKVIMTLVALFVVVVGGLLAPTVFSTRRKIEGFRTKFPPGSSVTDLVSFAGEPTEIIRKGHYLEKGIRSFKFPELHEKTAMYYFGEEGLPYYNVYVHVNEAEGEIISAEVEVLR